MRNFEKWWLEEIVGKGWIVPDRIKALIKMGWDAGQENAPLPTSIQEALNSGDGTYRP